MKPQNIDGIAEELLKESALFQGIDLLVLKELVAVMKLEHYAAGTLLFNKDDPGEEMFIILNGEVRIFIKNEDGHEFTIRQFSEGQIFGEFTLLDQTTRSTSADVTEDADLLCLDRNTFLEFMKTHAAIGLRMMRGLAGRIRYTTDYLQAVMDSTKLLSEGNYNNALTSITDSPDPNIHNLHAAFVDMIHRVKERQTELQKKIEAKNKAPKDG